MSFASMEWVRLCCIMLVLCGAFFCVDCRPPGPVVKCESDFTNCTVSNAYGAFPDRSICKAAQVVFPSTEKELIAYVATAVQERQKIRVVTRFSHSIPKLVCPGGDSGLLLSTRDLDRVLEVNKSAMTMTVESGISLGKLLDTAAEQGLALPHSPYWLGVSMGGMLGTGAHGSSLFGKGSAVHEYVIGMRLVVPASKHRGYARVVKLSEHEEDLNAAKVSLGVLGVISQVTLQLQPMFKRSITNVLKNDDDIQNSIFQFGFDHEFGDLTWYPSQRKAVYRVDDRIGLNTSGDGVNDFIGFRSMETELLVSLRQSEEQQEANRSDNCDLSKTQLSSILNIGTGLQNNDDGFLNYPVIGYQNKLQASGSCLQSADDELFTACPWDPRIAGKFFHQTTFSIGLSKIKDFLSDVKKLRDMVPTSLCGAELYNGFLMRYVKASTAYLGKQEDSVDIDITYYRAIDPKTPRLYEDVLEEIEQMGLLKYEGLSHWGKNRNLAFHGVIKKYSKAVEFLNAKNKFDPEGLFSNEWTDGMLGIGKESVIIKEEGCALEGLCICSEDAHCRPEKGYFCREGRVYREARVCRYSEIDNYNQPRSDTLDSQSEKENPLTKEATNHLLPTKSPSPVHTEL